MKKFSGIQYTKEIESPLGRILLACDGKNLTGLWFESQKHFAATLLPGDRHRQEKCGILEEAQDWLHEYFAGGKPDAGKIGLAPIGSDFRQSVWKILREVPYGEVITYGEISRRVAKERGLERMSAQAIGGAVANNPVSIFIPCHRAVGSNGSLTGYAGGLDKKVWLLTHEGTDMEKLFVPKER